uniref:Uncharacterized protein n=1 Tax=Chromera velia CCMP2878 TaxID=1169474 RepID=A0A0G4HPJ2_9ALVE|eukprot:Cvel_1230.t1-p1 / transcript=Cvel_1230.t1 / gene=Cvel_1230 / organism=Chromera_velia_CCMP2878 / gene_product=hypothetical protein / transcript_product=hypothetical protein / location=Cvel_scaffold41:46642-51192(-) / protein_length=188 / sequence_SO=supercontig / SO=protein_coding / is_pseudo=false
MSSQKNPKEIEKRLEAEAYMRDYNRDRWLERRGKTEYIEFDKQVRQELQKCFEGLAGGPNSLVPARQLAEAFDALGLPNARKQVENLARLGVVGARASHPDGPVMVNRQDFMDIIKYARVTNSVELFNVFRALLRNNIGDKHLGFPLKISLCRRQMILETLMDPGKSFPDGGRRDSLLDPNRRASVFM